MQPTTPSFSLHDCHCCVTRAPFCCWLFSTCPINQQTHNRMFPIHLPPLAIDSSSSLSSSICDFTFTARRELTPEAARSSLTVRNWDQDQLRIFTCKTCRRRAAEHKNSTMYSCCSSWISAARLLLAAAGAARGDSTVVELCLAAGQRPRNCPRSLLAGHQRGLEGV